VGDIAIRIIDDVTMAPHVFEVRAAQHKCDDETLRSSRVVERVVMVSAEVFTLSVSLPISACGIPAFKE
jgi:hypothetical protein